MKPVSPAAAAARRAFKGPLGDFLHILIRQLDRDRVLVRAAGLAYNTLLAIVPLVTVLFSLFSAFGALDELKARLREFLFNQFLPTRQDEIVLYLDQVTENTGRVGFLGTGLLVVSAVLLLNSVELNFNDIWRSSSRRSLLSKLKSYTSALVLGPLFLGTSLTLSLRLEALLGNDLELQSGLLQRIGDLALPYLLTLVGLILLFAVVPFGRVKLTSALLGASISGLLWEIAKNLFTDLASQSLDASKLYGSLAVIPIFIVWLYVTWVIVLIGLEIAYTHHHLRALTQELEQPGRQKEGRHVLALRLFGHIAREFDRGALPPTLEDLANLAAIRLDTTAEILARLADAGLVHVVDQGFVRGEGYLPSRSPSKLLINDLLAPFYSIDEASSDVLDPLDENARRLARTFTLAGQQALGEMTVERLIAAEEPSTESPPNP